MHVNRSWKNEVQKQNLFLWLGENWWSRWTSDITPTSGCPWPKATVKPPVWNPGPKIEIPHPENHVLKVFRFRSWKPWVWKSRPQSWDPKSWKPCPENHILKFPRPQSWDPMTFLSLCPFSDCSAQQGFVVQESVA